MYKQYLNKVYLLDSAHLSSALLSLKKSYSWSCERKGFKKFENTSKNLEHRTNIFHNQKKPYIFRPKYYFYIYWNTILEIIIIFLIIFLIKILLLLEGNPSHLQQTFYLYQEIEEEGEREGRREINRYWLNTTEINRGLRGLEEYCGC